MKRIPIRFNDQDAQGHVNHLGILEYVAEARIAALDRFVRRAGADGLDYVLVNIEADFIKEMKYPGWVEVDFRITAVGKKSVTTEYEVVYKNSNGWTEGGGPAAKALCVNVFFDTASGKTVPVPEKLRKLMEKEIDDG